MQIRPQTGGGMGLSGWQQFPHPPT
jgi:hypothetical protein